MSCRPHLWLDGNATLALPRLRRKRYHGPMPVRTTLRALVNPKPHIPVDEAVVFFPTAAAQADDGTWGGPIHGWIFRPADLSRLRRAAMRAVKLLLRRRVPADHPGMPMFERRAGSFLADNSRWKRIHVRLRGTDYGLKR